MQQTETKASQGGEQDQGQGWGGPKGWTIALVLVTAGCVTGQAQLAIGLVEGVLTGLSVVPQRRLEKTHILPGGVSGQWWQLGRVHLSPPCTHPGFLSSQFPPVSTQFPPLF